MNTWEPCVVCGKPRWHWSGSKLDRHARCLWDADRRIAILEQYEADPRLSAKQLAAELAITPAVLSGVIAQARRDRAARRAS